MNGLNRSPSASSAERPGGLAQASHAAASTAAIDETTRAVKVVEAMEGAIGWMVACILAWCVGFAAGGLAIGEWASLCDSRAAQVKRRVAIRPPAPFSSRAVLTPLADLQALPSGAGETAPDEPPEPP